MEEKQFGLQRAMTNVSGSGSLSVHALASVHRESVNRNLAIWVMDIPRVNCTGCKRETPQEELARSPVVSNFDTGLHLAGTEVHSRSKASIKWQLSENVRQVPSSILIFDPFSRPSSSSSITTPNLDNPSNK